MEESKEEIYSKIISPFYKEMVHFKKIAFKEKVFKVVETRKGKDRLPIDKVEKFGIFDPNRYKKEYLLKMCKTFIKENDFMKF